MLRKMRSMPWLASTRSRPAAPTLMLCTAMHTASWRPDVDHNHGMSTQRSTHERTARFADGHTREDKQVSKLERGPVRGS
jgi:hypothetical protein